MPLRFYRALIVQDADDTPEAGYGVVFPDFPGCMSSGETVQEAATMAAEALSLHVEGFAEADLPIPDPSAPDAPLPDWLEDASAKTAAIVLVPVETPGRSVRTNITLDEGLLARLDAAAAAAGMSRSGFIAEAVRGRLRGAKN